MDIQGGMAAVRLESSVTPNRASEQKGGLQGAAQFSACASGGYTTDIAGGGVNHRGLYGSRQIQLGLGSPCEVVPSCEGWAGPPHQGGTGSRFNGTG